MIYFPVYLWLESGVLYMGAAIAGMCYDYKARYELDAAAFILIMLSIVIAAGVIIRKEIHD